MKRHIRLIFLASFFFSFHLALLAYVNSSMLGVFASPSLVGIIYTISAALSLILVSISPIIIRRIGNVKYTGISLIITAILLFIISSSSGTSIIPFFILYFALNSVVLYSLDLFLEHYSADKTTGNIRGKYLALGSIGWVLAPISTTILQTSESFSAIYMSAAFIAIITFIVIVMGQRGFVDKIYKKGHLIDGINSLRKNKVLRNITFLNLMLQTYFVVMVIYSPVYLTTVIGFSWKTLGIILSVMLLPFVLLPSPTGKLADKYGEKRLMYLALFIMATATIIFIYIGAVSAAVYAIVLFATRIGASTLQTVCDSAFFKRVTDADSAVISTYRDMMPVAYTIGPLIAGLILALYSYKVLFIGISVAMAISMLAVYRIKNGHNHTT